MYSNFKEQAIEWVRQAIAADSAGDYPKAFPLYMHALEYFNAHLRHEKNPKIKDAITQKLTEYLRRAEEIRAVLDQDPAPAAAAVPINSKEQAFESVRRAVAEDDAGNYAEALPLYMSALEYFKTCIKHEKNPTIKDAITQKFNEYLRRAQEIRAVLDRLGPLVKTDKFGVAVSFREQAMEYVRQAVAEDNAGNYARAFPLYMNALEYLKTYLKYETNLKVNEAAGHKFDEYLRRAEEIRAVLDEGGPSGAARPGNDGEDGDKD